MIGTACGGRLGQIPGGDVGRQARAAIGDDGGRDRVERMQDYLVVRMVGHSR